MIDKTLLKVREVKMKKFKFLAPVTVLAAAFASDKALAIQEPSKSDVVDTETSATVKISEIVTVSNGNDTFDFVLKRIEGGELIAAHRSHSSHGSHRSHSSGY